MKTFFLIFTLLLIVLTLSVSSLYAQAPIKKPQKKQQTTINIIVTQQKLTTGAISGHEYIDLGLSVKWATCNVGASSPSDYGNYYAWGETRTKPSYTEENSKTSGKSMASIAGNSQYDAATANWGGTWRLPTDEETQELVDKCTWIWTSQGGNNGHEVIGPNGNSIFLPAAGWRGGTSLYDAGEDGWYWSAMSLEDETDCAFSLGFYSEYRLGNYYNSRDEGRSVRPVSD